MSWTTNPILISHDKSTPCEDIFQAVCDHLGDLYRAKGFKYSASRPKITYKDKDIKVEINAEKMQQIVSFIDEKIIPWIGKIKTEAGVLEFVENASRDRKSSLTGKGLNSDFIPYMKLHFSHIDIQNMLK